MPQASGRKPNKSVQHDDILIRINEIQQQKLGNVAVAIDFYNGEGVSRLDRSSRQPELPRCVTSRSSGVTSGGSRGCETSTGIPSLGHSRADPESDTVPLSTESGIGKRKSSYQEHKGSGYEPHSQPNTPLPVVEGNIQVFNTLLFLINVFQIK
jgi:hypothetical protein